MREGPCFSYAPGRGLGGRKVRRPELVRALDRARAALE
jgi:hypothetical protein